MTEANERLDEVYRARTPEQLQAAYGQWAKSYDRDIVDALGWDKPQRVGELLLEHTRPGERVLDCGAGTGLVGAFLATHGYRDLTALDFSPAMLDQARERGVYRDVVQMDLTRPLTLPSASYDVVVAVGVFTEGHVGPSCLAELARVSRGFVAFSLRDDLYPELGFAPVHAGLEAAGGWHLVVRRQFDSGLEGRPWSAWLYRVGPGAPGRKVQ